MATWYESVSFESKATGAEVGVSVTNDIRAPEIVISGTGSVPLNRSEAVRLANLFIRFLQETPVREAPTPEPATEDSKVVSMANWLETKGDPVQPSPDDVPPAI